jgi:uncharacterized protein YbaR (Trm112 family)
MDTLCLEETLHNTECLLLFELKEQVPTMIPASERCTRKKP